MVARIEHLVTSGRSYGEFSTIVDAVRERLLTLPPETAVQTGHGARTTIGAEAGDVEVWLARGR